MSLRGKTVWVVGGVGVVGRGIARGLLKAGATVIVNSRSTERLDRIKSDLAYPERLVPVLGSLRPGQAEQTVGETLKAGGGQLHHVVAHGAVRYWTTKRAGCDETYSLERTTHPKSLLDAATTPEEFTAQASQLAALHFSAARALIPRLKMSTTSSTSYTFVTGDGGGHPSARRSPMGEINSHHVWGLAAALRQELSTTVVCREVRIGLPVVPLDPVATATGTASERPLSEDIGDLCAGMVAMTDGDTSRLMRIESIVEMEQLLQRYRADGDHTVEPLPSFAEFVGSM